MAAIYLAASRANATGAQASGAQYRGNDLKRKRELLEALILLCVLFAADAVGYTQTQPIVVGTTVSCATSTDGSVVGIPNPLNPPVVAVAYSGTLGSGNYFVENAWYDAAGHITLVGPEVQIQLASSGSLTVNLPTSGTPQGALGMNVYIGSSSGGETLQGQTTGSATFTQSTALTSGAAVPSTNTTVCQIAANDAGWPTGTGYQVGLTAPSGDQIPGFPQQWQLLGPGQTINLGQGFPIYTGHVTYGSTIQAIPYNHGMQSISGPLSMAGYPLVQVLKLGVGTQVPAWPIDNELGATNSLGGYIYNGGVGVSTGEVLCAGSDPYHTFVPASSCRTGGQIYYQTIQANGTPSPQEPALNFSAYFNLTDYSTVSTNVGLNTTGSEGALVTASGSKTPGYYAVWDSAGGLTGVASQVPLIPRTCVYNGCYRKEADGTIEEWGVAASCGGGTNDCNVSVTFPLPFTSVPSVVDTCSDSSSNGGNCIIIINNLSTTNFVNRYGAPVYVGGGGGNLSGVQKGNWYAVGY